MRSGEARRYLGLGDSKFRSMVRSGAIPFWQDPETGTRWFSRPQLDEWARTLGGAA
jgi:excisionase family DNA binding protein